MKKLIVLSAFFTFSVFAANPVINSSELNGTFLGESANGPCTVKIQRLGDIMSLQMHQNMSDHQSIPMSTKAIVSKISGSQCGGKTMNNTCGTYELSDKIQNGGGYDNEVTIEAVSVKNQRCLKITIEDASFGDWIGGGHCTINMNRSGKGCGWE